MCSPAPQGVLLPLGIAPPALEFVDRGKAEVISCTCLTPIWIGSFRYIRHLLRIVAAGRSCYGLEACLTPAEPINILWGWRPATFKPDVSVPDDWAFQVTTRP